MKRRNFFAALAAPLVAPVLPLKRPDPPVEEYPFGWTGSTVTATLGRGPICRVCGMEIFPGDELWVSGVHSHCPESWAGFLDGLERGDPEAIHLARQFYVGALDPPAPWEVVRCDGGFHLRQGGACRFIFVPSPEAA